jgi:predicted nucleic acid-binding protein
MGLVRARWSQQILDEMFDALKRNRPDLDPSRLQRTRDVMCAAVPDCIVPLDAVNALIPALKLPDPDDRHVLAAAIAAGAQVIVTTNLKDFPQDVLRTFNIEAKHPDAFLQDIYHIDGVLTHQAVTEAAGALSKPPLTVGDLLDRLDELGLHVSASLLRR